MSNELEPSEIQRLASEIESAQDSASRRATFVRIVDAGMRALLKALPDQPAESKTQASTDGSVDLDAVLDFMAGSSPGKRSGTNKTDLRELLLNVLSLVNDANTLLSSRLDAHSIEHDTTTAAEALQEWLSRERVALKPVVERSRQEAGQVRGMQQQMAEIARELQDLERRVAKESEEAQSLRDRRGELQELLKQASSRRNQIQAEVSELNQQIEQLTREADPGRQLREEISRLKQEINEYEQAKEITDTEVQSLRERHAITKRLMQGLEANQAQHIASVRLREIWESLPMDIIDKQTQAVGNSLE